MNAFRRAAVGAVVAALAASMGSAPMVNAASSRGSPDSLTVFANVFNNPTPNYIANTCIVPVSMPDFTTLNSISGCGQTVFFSTQMMKLSVPASWPGWNSPPQTEGPTPDVFWTQGPVALTLRFSTPRKIAGFEIQPVAGVVAPFKAQFIDASGVTIGQINKTIVGGNGARLIAARMGPGTKVDTIVISSNIDFAIARIRFKP